MDVRGETYGKYELVDRIATGGMAEVYRAVSTSIGGFRKPVALKVILPHLSTDAEFVSMFIEEAKLSVSLTHGNIVQVFDFGRIDTNYFLAMELVEGKDLTRALVTQSRRGRPMPPEVALFVVIAVLRGLAHAHGRKDPTTGEPLGIVHRDVSPHNVLVSFEGEVKLADFGIATAASKVSLTRPGMRLGKFAYMSPEQARGQPIDARSDLWSAAVTLYECLTGARLFFDDDPTVTLERVRNPRVLPPSTKNPQLSPTLDELVLAGLHPDPEGRPTNARAYASELQSELQRISPGFDDSDLIRYLADLFEDEVGRDRFPDLDAPVAAPRPAVRADTRAESHVATRFDLPSNAAPREAPELERLQEAFRHAPGLDPVVELAGRLAAADRPSEAALLHRASALKYAQANLRAQAVDQLVRVRALEGWTQELAAEVERLPGLANASNSGLRSRFDFERAQSWSSFLEEVLNLPVTPRGAANEEGLLTALDGMELSKLAAALRTERVPPGRDIVREGELGHALYVVVRGRVLVHCTSFHGARVYLSSLSEGDGFGEQSFFTGEPRAATVETLDEVDLLVVERRQLDAVQARFPRLTRALHRFHRRRVMGTLLAKSEVFGPLRTRERQWLMERLEPVRFPARATILREGEDGDDVYIVSSGEVEVYRGETELFLDKLRRGDVFGEGAALSGRRRTASVRALGSVELLRLQGQGLRDLCARSSDTRGVLEAQVRRREAETLRRLTDGGLLI